MIKKENDKYDVYNKEEYNKEEYNKKNNEINNIINNYINCNNYFDYINYISEKLIKDIVNIINLNFSICPKETYNYYIDYFIEQNLNDYYKNNLNNLIYDNILDYVSKYIYNQKKFITDNDYDFIEKYTNNFLNKNYPYIRLCINNHLLKYKK